MEEKELQAYPQREVSPASLIQTALEKGVPIEQLERLMELKERHEANEARKAYNVAIASFKAENIQIIKDAEVDFTSQKGRTHYRHATLAGVIAQIIDKLSKYGLSHSWAVKQDGQNITVTCRISHIDGHFEEVSMTATPDNSGNKNSIQAVGSTTTYLQRYTLKSALGLAEKDDDGKGADPGPQGETIDEEQAANIDALLAEVNADVQGFLTYYKIPTIDSLPANKYNHAVKSLENKRRVK